MPIPIPHVIRIARPAIDTPARSAASSPPTCTFDQSERVGVIASTAFLVSLMVIVLVMLAGSVSAAGTAKASGEAGNPSPVTPHPQATTRDLAITSIVQVGPPFANQGDLVTIQVGVSNNGSASESATVNLTDEVSAEIIASQTVTLAPGNTTTLTMEWDTTHASGGPPPPGPPTPGTIHAITASVGLEDDGDESNDSLSLLPGIWIIAAPEPEGISFSDPFQVPEARNGEDQSLTEPSAFTLPLPVSTLFVTGSGSMRDGVVSPPYVATMPTTLVSIFDSGIDAHVVKEFSRPEILTVAVPAVGVIHDRVMGDLSRGISEPFIGTVATPLDGIYSPQSPSINLPSGAPPRVTTSRSGLSGVFSGLTSTALRLGLRSPVVVTESPPTAQIHALTADARAEGALAIPNVAARSLSLEQLFTASGSSHAGSALRIPSVDTVGAGLTGIFPGQAVATGSKLAAQPQVATGIVPLSQPFVVTGSGLKRSPRPLADPFASGAVSGRVLLRERESSLGAYIEIGDRVTFVSREGYFAMQVPAEPFTMNIRAPGHLSVTLGGMAIETGKTLELRDIILDFGDANGDEVIDILDLTVAADNFGLMGEAAPVGQSGTK